MVGRVGEGLVVRVRVVSGLRVGDGGGGVVGLGVVQSGLGVVAQDGGGDGLDGDGVGGRGLVDDGVESVVVVGGVLDGALAAVGLDEGVAALDYVTVAGLLLGLDVAGVGVVDAVAVAVLGVGVVLGLDDLGVDSQRGGVGVGQGGGLV